MSATRQDFGPWATLAKTHAAGSTLARHQHRTGQLVFAIRGVMMVETSASRWTIPPQRALWLPPGQPHEIHMLSTTEMRSVYCQPELIADCDAFARQEEVHVVVASALIRELVLGLFDERFEHATRHLMVRLLLQALQQSACLPTHLPMPQSEPLRRATTLLLDSNDWGLPMEKMAAEACMSERTFTRHFSAETGMNFRSWRQRARIVASLDLLTSEKSVKAIARALEFSSAAAYIAAFRELLGCSPSVFRREAGQ